MRWQHFGGKSLNFDAMRSRAYAAHERKRLAQEDLLAKPSSPPPFTLLSLCPPLIHLWPLLPAFLSEDLSVYLVAPSSPHHPSSLPPPPPVLASSHLPLLHPLVEFVVPPSPTLHVVLPLLLLPPMPSPLLLKGMIIATPFLPLTLLLLNHYLLSSPLPSYLLSLSVLLALLWYQVLQVQHLSSCWQKTVRNCIYIYCAVLFVLCLLCYLMLMREKEGESVVFVCC